MRGVGEIFAGAAMFGSDILEIALGLVLVYLLLSLVMTSVQEALQQLMKTRAVVLRNAVTELLQNDPELLTRFYAHPLVFALHRGTRTFDASPPAPAGSPPAASSPPGAAAVEAVPTRYELPSYIPRDVFSAALVDLMEEGGTGNVHLRQAYEGLRRFAAGDVKQLRREVENWYDGAMDRASGAYKRHAQLSLFILGLVVAGALNVNSVIIARHLATDPQARQLADQMAVRIAREGLARPDEDEANAATGGNSRDPAGNGAEATAEAAPADPAANLAGGDPAGGNAQEPSADSSGSEAQPVADQAALEKKVDKADQAWKDFNAQMDQVGLPVGWSDASIAKIRATLPREKDAKGKAKPAGFWRWVGAIVTLLFGYVLTAVAITLGAPFWFDLLNRIMVIRSTVKPKEKSPDEPSQDGGRAGRGTGSPA